MANKYIDELPQWPTGTPLPADARPFFYDPTTDREWTFLPGQLLALAPSGPSGTTRDLLDLTPDLMDTVMALAFTGGDAPLSATPAGSYPGQWFDAVDANGDEWHYYCGRGNYTPGTPGSGVGPRWSRVPKG